MIAALLALAFMVFKPLSPGTGLGLRFGPATIGPTRAKLYVLAYSAFVATWGPGPEIARRFTARTGIEVELRDADDAGLLLKKLELFPSDVVVGLDQPLLTRALQTARWKELPAREARFQEREFAAFDWGPIAFVYRAGEVSPPESLNDLLDARFKRAITLPDPRLSSPGFQLLMWVLQEKGFEEGFAFLKRLKPAVRAVAPSWSSSYGLFQSGQAKLALSYLTSPVYHSVNDKDETYRAAVFAGGHPLQIEYAGVPESCVSCAPAIEFVLFLLEPSIQKLIMERNYMLPVVEGVVRDTPFARLPPFTVLKMSSAPELLERREEILKRWRELGL